MEWRRFVTYLWNDPRIYSIYITITNSICCTKFSVNTVTKWQIQPTSKQHIRL